MCNQRPIILIEDNPDDERLTLRSLKRANVANPILIARNGEEALPLIFKTIPPPSLVLLDLKIPKLNGLEVLQKIRSHEPTRLLPVVIFTSSNEERDILESYRLGANSYVQKPINFDQFVEAIAQLGLYWLFVNKSLPS